MENGVLHQGRSTWTVDRIPHRPVTTSTDQKRPWEIFLLRGWLTAQAYPLIRFSPLPPGPPLTPTHLLARLPNHHPPPWPSLIPIRLSASIRCRQLPTW